MLGHSFDELPMSRTLRFALALVAAIPVLRSLPDIRRYNRTRNM
jgi:hypothetical protein